jgi:hypothetical protein
MVICCDRRALVRRSERGDKHDPVEVQPAADVVCDQQMSQMHWVERAAEQPDASAS